MPAPACGSHCVKPILLAVLAMCAWNGVASQVALAASPDARVEAWQQRLGQLELHLRRLPAADTAAAERLGADLRGLRVEIADWLASFREAEGGWPWLEPAGQATGLEELAAEIGRLRSALLRIAVVMEKDGEGPFYLGRVDVAVTAATPVAGTTEMTPAGATVLHAADLRANDRTALAGALALAPGVTFTRIGSRNETAVYVRGFDMRQVPLFIDGIPIYTPYDGYADLDRFTTFDVAEVRVSKGFASVLYGPNALGGAVNIVSRRPAGRIDGVAGASYGTGTARTTYVNAGSRLGQVYVQGGGSYLDAATFPLAGGFPAVRTQPAGDRVNASRRDGKFNAKFGWTPNGTDEYAVSYVGQRGKKDNPPYAGSDPLVKVRFWRWPNWDKDSLYFVSNTHLGSWGYLRARAFRDAYDNSLYSFDDATYTTQVKSSSFRSRYHDKTLGGSIEWGSTVGRHSLRAAGHVKNDQHQDYNDGETPKEFRGRIASVGVEDTFAWTPVLSLVAGIGADWQTTTRAFDYQKAKVIDLLASCAGASCGDAGGVSPQIGAFYTLPVGQLRLTLSRKTRMPSLKDRYSYKFGTAVPNPDLRAERNLTVESGYQGTLDQKTSFVASVFYSRIDDLIQRFYLQPNLSQQRNIGKASHAGIELDARTRIVPRLDFGANYTFLRRENLSDPATPLVDAPRHKGRVSLTATPAPYLQVVGSVEFEAGRKTQNEAGSYVMVPSFTVLNVKGVWTIRRELEAELGLFNAFDKYYWVADGYPEPGRTVLASVRFRF